MRTGSLKFAIFRSLDRTSTYGLESPTISTDLPVPHSRVDSSWTVSATSLSAAAASCCLTSIALLFEVGGRTRETRILCPEGEDRKHRPRLYCRPMADFLVQRRELPLLSPEEC